MVHANKMFEAAFYDLDTFLVASKNKLLVCGWNHFPTGVGLTTRIMLHLRHEGRMKLVGDGFVYSDITESPKPFGQEFPYVCRLHSVRLIIEPSRFLDSIFKSQTTTIAGAAGRPTFENAVYSVMELDRMALRNRMTDDLRVVRKIWQSEAIAAN